MSLKIGLIGCGKWGANILRDLCAMGVEVIVVEPDPAVAHRTASAFQVPVLSNLEDIGEVAGFIIATPASTHIELIRCLLPHRIPIFVEKPLATDRAEANSLTRIPENLIFVMHVWHYHSGIEMLSQIRESGELGQVQMLRTERKNWTSPRIDVDSTWNLIPHDLSIAKRILGILPEPAYAVAEFKDQRVAGMLAVLGTGAPRVVIDVSNRFRDKRREVRLHCEKGVAVLPADDSGFIEITRECQDDANEDLQTETRKFDFIPPLKRELEVFVNYLKGGTPPQTGLKDGIEVVETVSKLRRLAGL